MPGSIRTRALVIALSAVVMLVACPFRVAAQSAPPPQRAVEPQALLMRAGQGDPAAQHELGSRYESGEGVPQDDAQAAFWYRKAADQGHADAQKRLGALYHAGRGVPQDDAQAVAWSRKAAEQGNAAAQFNLGVLYHEGQGVPQDYAEAAFWYRQAADQGLAIAQFNLGASYNNGEGVLQDYAEAYKWLSLAVSAAQSEDQTDYAKGRDIVARKMSPAQVADARQRAREWREAFEKEKP